MFGSFSKGTIKNYGRELYGWSLPIIDTALRDMHSGSLVQKKRNLKPPCLCLFPKIAIHSVRWLCLLLLMIYICMIHVSCLLAN
jgi:hypothetical protein